MGDPIPFEFNPDVSRQYHALKLGSQMRPIYASTFLLSWRDSRTNDEIVLGDIPAKDQRHRAVWFVTFGANRETGELLLHVCFPLKIGGTSRGIWPIYLAFTPESFDADAANPDSCLKVSALPTTPYFEKAGVQAGTKLVQCRFKLKKQSMVIMPLPSSQISRKPLSEHFRGLLLSLKSLSQATSFDIYLPHTAQSWDIVLQFCRTLHSGSCRSPEIDYKATFNGRNIGKTDWKAYGIDDEDTLAVGWNPIVEQSPPSYDEAVQSSPQRIKEAPPMPDKSPEQQDSGNPPKPSKSPIDESPLCSDEKRENNPQGDSEVRDERSETRQDGEAQDSLLASIEVRAHGHLQNDDQCKGHYPQSERRLKRKAGEALSETELTGGHSTRAGAARESASMAASSNGFSLTFDNSREGMEGRAVEILLKSVTVGPGSVLDPKGVNRRYFDDRQFCWFCDAVLWLRSAWVRQHSILKSHLKELVAMCECIRLQKRKEFSEVRRMCMAKFVQQKPIVGEEGPWGVRLKERASWVGDFIYRELGAGSDTLVIDELAPLHFLANEWRSVGGDRGKPRPGREQDYARWQFSFNTQMAACILLAMYKGGKIAHTPGQWTWEQAQGGKHSSVQDIAEQRSCT